LKLIFEMMIAIEFEVDESWKVPEEGFCEKDEEEEGGVDIDYAKVGRKLVSRLIDSVGDKYLLQPCLTSIQQALASAGDWRVSYAALMTLSEVLQYVEDDDRLIEALPIIYNNIASDHCKIRYAAFHVLGQICEDHGPDFQKKHHESIYPKLLQGLEDSVPRVVAHACAAVTNFIENIGPVLGSQYAALIVPKISTFLEAASPSIVVENTFTCLAAIANTVGEGFKTYYMPLLRNAIVLFEKYNQNQYRALLGRLIECITLTSKAVGKQTFDPFAYKVVSLMKYLQETGNSQEEITGYLMNGWQRICELLGEEFLAYADNIVPGLLKLISNNVEMSTSSAPTHFVDMALATEKKRKNFSTTETENKELGIQTLITFVEELKGGYIKYVESTVLATFPLLDFSLNEGVRSAAAVLLSSLVGIIKPVDLPKAIVMAKTFMEGIWNAIDDEYINETLVDELEAIREIIDTIQVPFLSQEEVKAIGQKSLKILENSLENRIKTQEDSDDEKDEGFQEYTKKEEDSLHTSISEVFGVLFKTHKNSCLEIVDFLYVQVFGRLLAPDTRDEDHKFVIFVIDDILEFLGQELVKEKWNNFGEVLVKFACDPHDAVRQAAVYGLGVFAQFTSVDSFAPWSSPIMEKLEAAITLPPGKSIKSHGNARDNAIASVGKLIKYQSSSLNLNAVVPAWLNLLPLKFDKIECKVINDLITDLLLDKPAILLGENYENLKHVTFLLIDALDTKFIKETTVPKVKEFFNRLQNLQINQVTQVWAQLNDSQKEKLSSLVKSSF
jgi:importin-5